MSQAGEIQIKYGKWRNEDTRFLIYPFLSQLVAIAQKEKDRFCRKSEEGGQYWPIQVHEISSTALRERGPTAKIYVEKRVLPLLQFFSHLPHYKKGFEATILTVVSGD